MKKLLLGAMLAADLYQIGQLEVKWHRAASRKDLDLAVSIFAPNATLQLGGNTFTGRAALRKVFAAAAPSQPQNHWISDTPAYKIRETVHGKTGTIYFECDSIDVDTGKVVRVVGGDSDVRKINGKWLIVHQIGGTPTLKP